jgi:hypothetical protein
MTGKKPVPEMLIEQLLLQELPLERQKELLRELQEQEGGTERLQTLRLSNSQILDAYPPEQIAAQIARRATPEKAKRRAQKLVLWTAPLLPAAAACAILLWLANPSGLDGSPKDQTQKATQSKSEATRTKGQPRLLIYRKVGQNVEELQNMAQVSPKDLLQLRYLSAGARYGVIFSVDGRGSVSLHFPETVGHSTALGEGAIRSLPYAYELDDAPGFERFFFITSLSPIDIKAVLKLGHELGFEVNRPLVLPEGLDQTGLTLRTAPAAQKVEL